MFLVQYGTQYILQMQNHVEVMIIGVGLDGFGTSSDLTLSGVRLPVMEWLAHEWQRTERRSS